MRNILLNIIIPFCLFIGFYSHELYSQGCIEYPDIEGADCENCVPDGWDMEVPSPGIVDPSGNWGPIGCLLTVDGESPGGGNMALMGGVSGFFESISTTVTGLDPSIGYSFGLYWHYSLSCEMAMTFGESELVVTINDEEYVFEGSQEWELIEICLEPGISSAEIIIAGEPTTAMLGVILVDTAPCEDLVACCALTLDLDDEEVELCAGDVFSIDAFYDNEEGSVEIEWTCEPPSGLNFLSGTNIIDPEFLFPFAEDHDGGEYVFTVTVEDDNCVRMDEITIIVIPNEVPEFEITICELSFIESFPSESLNGYTGIWDGDFDFEDLVGTVQEYTFIIDPNQGNCLEEYVYEIPILPAIELEILYDDLYCVLDDTDYELPDDPEQDVDGEWVEEEFNPSDLGVGTYVFTFLADEEYCAFPFEAEIEVFEESILSFNLPNSFCQSNETLTLPTVSDEAIVGQWSLPQIDLSTIATNQSVVFTPNEGYCYQDYEYIYSVKEAILASFIIPDTICRESIILQFNSTSLEGDEGVWTPQAINLDTVMSDNVDIFWLPLTTSNDVCVDTLFKKIYIQEPKVSLFELPKFVCRSSDLFELPVTDVNGLEGTWNIGSFVPDTITGQVLNLTFTPFDSCALVFSDSIEIFENIFPEFSIPNELCSTDVQLVLPLVSDNNILGNWTIGEINPSSIVDSIVTTFIPELNDSVCYVAMDFIFYINDLIVPEFDLPSVFCSDGEMYQFELLSNNNIAGTWEVATFNPSTFSGTELVNVFTPDDISCNDIVEVIIPIVNLENLGYTISHPTSCASSNGEIVFQDELNLEFSIDDGVTWQPSGLFNNLDAAAYNILVREANYIECIQTFTISLTSPEVPIINMLTSTGVSDCGYSDGMVTCEAVGSDLEYSINGIDWQESSFFDGLAVGSYIMRVRSNGDSDCLSEQNFSIADVEQINIDDVGISNLSDCNANDGQLSVMPLINTLEYSLVINEDWQESNIFNDLEAGDYTVYLRISASPNCIDSLQVSIESPQNPINLISDSEDPSDCQRDDGTISLQADGNNLEYSIDNGLTWQSSGDFIGLASGVYEVMVREIFSPSCFVTEEIILEAPNVPEIESYNVSAPSDCIANDGSIEIVTSSNNVAFSLNGGANWQSENSFINLEEGLYTVVIRNVDSPDCTTSLEFEVLSAPCPCNKLDVEVIVTNNVCDNPSSGAIEIINIEGFYTNDDYSIEWSNGSNALMLADIPAGWYTYTISHDKNCTYIDSVFVEGFDPLTFGLLSFDPNCKEGGVIEVTDIDGGSGEFMFSLDEVNFQEETVFYNLSASEYEVFISDNFGCQDSERLALIGDYNLSLELPIINPIRFGETVTLNPLINQMTIDSFDWTPMTGITNPNTLIAEVSPLETTTYTLTIYFGDCVEERSITVEILEENDLYIGNIFSPNGDGNNDKIFVQSSSRANVSLEAFSIFDRWGNMVFTNNNLALNDESEGWDGYYNDQEAEIGVYTYLLVYEASGQQLIKAGTLTLTR